MNRIKLTESDLHKIIRTCVGKILQEGLLDRIYLSDSFKKWFSGSKMVDDNGRPLLLGHATRSFGFDKFNTDFIHLSSFDDASFFSGGNRRMFRDKETIGNMSDEEIIELYNKFFTYGDKSNEVELLDDETARLIALEYNSAIEKTYDPEEIAIHKKYGMNIEKEREILPIFKKIFLNHYKENRGNICYLKHDNGMPTLSPYYYDYFKNKERQTESWLNREFPTVQMIREKLANDMFTPDRYEGKGGTYPLCARVLNPLHVDCHWNTWDCIYIYKDFPEYDEFLDKYCEETGKRITRGSSFGLDNESIAYIAKQLGYDGVVFHNIREGAYGEARMRETYIVFSTKQLKSPFENNGNFGDVENMFK